LLGWVLVKGMRKLDINSVNLCFLFVGMLLQGSLRRYVEAVSDGAKGAGAIILQFPLYFGILGLMKASGMIAWLSDAMVELSSQASFPSIAYLSAGIVNLFVPSGGGQWGVQRDILLSSGASLEVDPALTIMAFSYGDAWTNMLQPFWALPLLGIMGLRARDIIGYTAMVFLLMAVVVPLGLAVTM
jgi:short-chain fatty acids transporter